MGPFAPKIYGTTVLNDKGQAVIPAEARNALGLEPGARLMVMGMPHGRGLMLMKTEQVEEMIKKFSVALDDKAEDKE